MSPSKSSLGKRQRMETGQHEYNFGDKTLSTTLNLPPHLVNGVTHYTDCESATTTKKDQALRNTQPIEQYSMSHHLDITEQGQEKVTSKSGNQKKPHVRQISVKVVAITRVLLGQAGPNVATRPSVP